MKINELIHKLIDIQTREGNLEVFIDKVEVGLDKLDNIEILNNNGTYNINNNLIEKFILLGGPWHD
jgi:hypothetical protein